MEAIYEPQRTNLMKTSINLTESKKCNSGQDISKKNVIKSASASCERRLYAKEVGDIKSNLDGTHDITSSSSFQNVQCLKPYNLITTNASPELTAKEREQVCQSFIYSLFFQNMGYKDVQTGNNFCKDRK